MHSSRDFLEICDDRYAIRSTVLTSQVPLTQPGQLIEFEMRRDGATHSHFIEFILVLFGQASFDRNRFALVRLLVGSDFPFSQAHSS